MLLCVCEREKACDSKEVCVCVVCSTETLIKDIEHHFSPSLSDDKITTRPEVFLFAL